MENAIAALIGPGEPSLFEKALKTIGLQRQDFGFIPINLVILLNDI